MLSHAREQPTGRPIRLLVGALAARYPPELVTFLLIDFKGGATFLGLAVMVAACAGHAINAAAPVVTREGHSVSLAGLDGLLA